MNYEVTEGGLANQNGYWNPDGKWVDATVFESLEEALAYFRSCDPRDRYLTEKSCGGVGMRNRGYYADLHYVTDGGEDIQEIEGIDGWKQYTADDYVSEL